MNEETIHDETKIPPHADAGHNATALSLFDQAGGANDFPVLKAFQEYIEAEQARSRKRMLGLSIFFVILLVVVVITFSVIMAAVINRDQQNLSSITARNQELSDKLLDIALRERSTPQQPVVNVQPAAPQIAPLQQPSQDSVIKPLLEKIESLTSALVSKPQQTAVQQPVVTPVESPETIRLREELRLQKEAIEKIRAEREKLKAEEELKVERERLRREQVELHRRRLYPEHYAREDARKELNEEAKKIAVTKTPQPSPPQQLQQQQQQQQPAALPKPPAPPPPPKPKLTAKPVDLKTAKPISYFDEPEEQNVKTPPAAKPATESKNEPEKGKSPSPPPPPKAESAQTDAKPSPGAKAAAKPAAEKKIEQPEKVEPKTETLNVSGKDGDSVPFLIELPAAAK